MFQTQLFVLKQKRENGSIVWQTSIAKICTLIFLMIKKSIANQITGRFPFFLDFSLHISQYFILKAIDDELKLWFEFYLALLILRCTWQWALNVRIARNHILSIIFSFFFFFDLLFMSRLFKQNTKHIHTHITPCSSEWQMKQQVHEPECIFGSCCNVVHTFNARQTV